MPRKDGCTISDERSIEDAALRWPDGARCCVSITVDLSLAAGPEGIRVADLGTPVARFAMTEGLDNLLDTLRRHGMRTTFATPAAMARILGPRIAAIRAEGHEIAAQGLRHEDVSVLSRAEEKAPMQRATDDVPHWWVTDFATRRALLTLPYYFHFDDQFFCMFPQKGPGSRARRCSCATGGRSSRRSVPGGGTST